MKYVPFWRMELELHKEDEFCSPRQRCLQLRSLKELFEREVRRSFRFAAADPDLASDRSVLWTPIPGICHNLELAHSHLSRMLRELTGLNAIQTYDKLKINHLQIPLKYIELIEQFLHSLAPNPSSLAPYSPNGSKHFWKWLKAERKNPDFDRQAFARDFGFPSANRFHRALFFATGHTPREFENLVIRLAIDDPDALKTLIAKFPPEEHIEQLISRDYDGPTDNPFPKCDPTQPVAEIPDPEPEMPSPITQEEPTPAQFNQEEPISLSHDPNGESEGMSSERDPGRHP